MKKYELTEFKEVRDWGKIRGISGASPDVQYQRFLQEAVEIHEAMINDDEFEFKDAIGDTIVTLIMLAGTKNIKAEDCLEQAFNVIKFRKGLNKNGSFVRYGKLSSEEQTICDNKQGHPGSEYFLAGQLGSLSAEDFSV